MNRGGPVKTMVPQRTLTAGDVPPPAPLEQPAVKFTHHQVTVDLLHQIECDHNHRESATPGTAIETAPMRIRGTPKRTV